MVRIDMGRVWMLNVKLMRRRLPEGLLGPWREAQPPFLTVLLHLLAIAFEICLEVVSV